MNNDLIDNLKTPCHIVDIEKIKLNIESLLYIKNKTNAKILFAIKGFSNDKITPMFISSFDGVSASGLWEAKYGKELLKKTVHTYSSAYKKEDFSIINKYSDYIIFNSISQLNAFTLEGNINSQRLGIRINPEYSEVKKYSINPCHQFSRFGVTRDKLSELELNNVSGLHFHSMCEQYEMTLDKTLSIVSNNFNEYLYQINWLNIGGGQLYSDENYNLNQAVSSINFLQNKYNLDIFLEPCETVVLNAGYTVASVVDIVHNGITSAILDLSAICHLPDIVNSPYRCEILNASLPYEKEHTYRLTGCTCYAGDIFGDYSFDKPLEIGSKIIFLDTAAYSMVKNNYFNGMIPPYYAVLDSNKKINIVKEYNYKTFLSIL